MPNVAAIIAGLALTVNCSTISAASSQTPKKHGGTTTGCMVQFPQSNMFDGIDLTEHQRQLMRDLMERARRQLTHMNPNDFDTLYKLTTANQFDERAYRRGLKKFAQKVVKQQLIYARVYHQLYRLLTPHQRAICDKNHQRFMVRIRELIEIQPVVVMSEQEDYQ